MFIQIACLCIVLGVNKRDTEAFNVSQRSNASESSSGLVHVELNDVSGNECGKTDVSQSDCATLSPSPYITTLLPSPHITT
ncbi:hypothetical protein V6N12_016814 [Hibiscus sabdariffa]|uniref:Secreted protein n=1 Tax=Hibiscus sabdariffa TaxID=183260 RepID=A0ABR2BPG8_9ROSI